jgi:hypothetical protein
MSHLDIRLEIFGECSNRNLKQMGQNMETWEPVLPVIPVYI